MPKTKEQLERLLTKSETYNEITKILTDMTKKIEKKRFWYLRPSHTMIMKIRKIILDEWTTIDNKLYSEELNFDNDIDTLLTDPKASKGIWSLCGEDKRLITALFKKEKIRLIEEIKAGLPKENYISVMGIEAYKMQQGYYQQQVLTLLDRMYEK